MALKRIILFFVWTAVVTPGFAVETASSISPAETNHYFKIQIVDRQTGRGVPLVELRTVNNIRYYTDSNGIVAFHEPGLMNQDVFFFVTSHGYAFPKDGFGMQGRILKTIPGASITLSIDRLNIAERLYRVTGQGIYRDSSLTNHPIPLENPLLNGKVVGQDSVFTCRYRNRLYWFWGDTGKPSYPLGNFSMSGAWSELPENGGLDPAVGVDLYYFVGDNGFSRPMSPLPEPGLVWLDGLMTIADKADQTRIVARYARLKSMTEILERGFVVFNNETQTFERLVRGELDFLPYTNTGHAFPVQCRHQDYYYFCAPSPLAIRMRVPTRWEDVINEQHYEVLTALKGESLNKQEISRLDSTETGKPFRWIRFEDLNRSNPLSKSELIKALNQEAKDPHVIDFETGKPVIPHNGTVYFNPYRNCWIAIFTQHFGESSVLGEIWYAEADTPVGPWGYARKIVTHNKYSFYNPKQHPLFAQDGGRTIYFEGTYSFAFSGTAEAATPRYDYNQIMYRLHLDDPRLTLPVAVYCSCDESGNYRYRMRNEFEKANSWESIDSLSFYAVEPTRDVSDLIPIFATNISTANEATWKLTVKRPHESDKPLFYALPAADIQKNNARIVPLFEYRHSNDGRYFYSIDPRFQKKDWIRQESAICRVWKPLSQMTLADYTATPATKK